MLRRVQTADEAKLAAKAVERCGAAVLEPLWRGRLTPPAAQLPPLALRGWLADGGGRRDVVGVREGVRAVGRR